jgi:hypothetical protein
MEILGRLIATILMMALASAAGVVCALIVFILLRRFKIKSRRTTVMAALFPPAAMTYLICIAIASSTLSSSVGTPDVVFGDIHEALPNGFSLSALGKMPEAGRIEKDTEPSIQVAWVNHLQTSGPLVLGEYDYQYFPKFEGQSNRNFFLLDTRNGKTLDFATESDLSKAANIPVHLIATQFFHAPKSSAQRLRDLIVLVIAFLPPITVGLYLLWKVQNLIRKRKKDLET